MKLHFDGAIEVDGTDPYVFGIDKVCDNNSFWFEVKGGYTRGRKTTPEELHATAKRLVGCWNALCNVAQDTLDGGWTSEGINRYAILLERQREGLRAQLAAPREVTMLHWDVRNANEQTGAQAFATEELAIEQARIWLQSAGLDTAALERELTNLRDEGWCYGRSSDDEYRITTEKIRTEVTP